MYFYFILGPLQTNPENDVYHYNNRIYGKNPDTSHTDKQRQLFNWGDNNDRQTSQQGVYGDGPRRLPLINGIWPPHDQKEQVLAFGPQSTPGPKTMIKEEIDIAELRNKQLEELKKQRYSDLKGKCLDVRKGIVLNINYPSLYRTFRRIICVSNNSVSYQIFFFNKTYFYLAFIWFHKKKSGLKQT